MSLIALKDLDQSFERATGTVCSKDIGNLTYLQNVKKEHTALKVDLSAEYTLWTG